MSYILEVDHENGQCASSKRDFAKLLSRVERGKEILIMKRRNPYQPPRLMAERQDNNHAIEVMAQGLAGARPYELSRAMKCTSGDSQL
jgi:hypothetical protein